MQHPQAPADRRWTSALLVILLLLLKPAATSDVGLDRRKQNFEQQMQSETDSIARQMEQLANFQAPPARVELSPYVKRSLSYCLRCHDWRSNVEIAEFFDRAGNFFH